MNPLQNAASVDSSNPLRNALADFKRRSQPKTQSVELREDNRFGYGSENQQKTISIDDLDFDQELTSECLSPEETLLRMEEEDLWFNIWTDC